MVWYFHHNVNLENKFNSVNAYFVGHQFINRLCLSKISVYEAAMLFIKDLEQLTVFSADYPEDTVFSKCMLQLIY